MVDWLKCFLIFATNDWLNDKEVGYDENNICRIQSTTFYTVKSNDLGT